MSNIFNNIFRGETWSIAADFTHIAHPFDEPNETQSKHQDPPLWDRIGGSVLFALSLLFIVPGCFYLYWASKKIDVIDSATPGSPEGKTHNTVLKAPPIKVDEASQPNDPEPSPLVVSKKKVTPLLNSTPPKTEHPPKTKATNPPLKESPSALQPFSIIPADPDVLAEARRISKINDSHQRDLEFKIFFGCFPEWDATKVTRLQLLGNEKEGLDVLYMLCPRFKEKHWEILTDEQVLTDAARLAGEAKTTAQFFKLFPIDGEVRKRKRLTHLFGQNPNAFYAISHRLGQSHWNLFGATQAMQLDFSRIDKEKRQDAFNAALAPVLSQLPICPDVLNKILEIKDAFREIKNVNIATSWWKALNEEQVLEIAKDFPKFTSGLPDIHKNKIFEHFFGYPGGNKEITKKSLRLTQLGTDEKGLKALYTLIPYFNLLHWEALSDEQILALDLFKLKKTEPEVLRVIFQENHADRLQNAAMREKLEAWLKLID